MTCSNMKWSPVRLPSARHMPILLISFLSAGCAVWQNGARHELTDGFYRQRSTKGDPSVFVKVTGDTLRLYAVSGQRRAPIVDASAPAASYWQGASAGRQPIVKLAKRSFDVDFLTIPVKIRASAGTVPAQLNTSLNGAVFLGFRNDTYNVVHHLDPLGITARTINHFGYSLGVFSGFGNTFMSPTNTNNLLQQEYDGIVWNKGLAGIVGLNNLTVGLAVGLDDLLDKNRDIWIYQRKPWVGFVFGLNLN